MTEEMDFFHKKKDWSRYKDLILDYYLEPYLAKVATLRRPVVVVDCFAGPGQFEDGEPGSPLIISKRLRVLQERGTKVLGLYVERDPVLYERLHNTIKDAQIPTEVKLGDFRQYVNEISDLARDHTIFLYLDPIKPSDLLFADLNCVYDQLDHGRSVEVLINFMSSNFWRAVRGLASQLQIGHDFSPADPLILRWDNVAGGTYWRAIVCDTQVSNADGVERLAEGYSKKLAERFEWVIHYPIRAKYKHRFPKYHLVFGSRHPDAIELMNRAMVKARREFVKAQYVTGFLFPNEPETEVVRPCEIERMVVQTSCTVGRVRWKELRVRVTVANPCSHTDSEFNKAIKCTIQKGRLLSNCPGRRIEEDAWVWPPA